MLGGLAEQQGADARVLGAEQLAEDPAALLIVGDAAGDVVHRREHVAAVEVRLGDQDPGLAARLLQLLAPL